MRIQWTFRTATVASITLLSILSLQGCGWLYLIFSPPYAVHESGEESGADSSTRPKPHVARLHRRAEKAELQPSLAPVVTSTVAPFLGNLSTIAAASDENVILQRQADCSLTFATFTGSGTPPGPYAAAITSQTAGYEKTIHDNAFLATTPDVFAKGCVDINAGFTSQNFLYLTNGLSGKTLLAFDPNAVNTFSATASPFAVSNTTEQTTDIASYTITGGDLNKDGNPDIVSINTDGINSSVSVILGNSGGTYKAAVNYDLPGQVISFGVLDDLNGDGNLDLIVNGGNNSFVIYIGKGDGTFNAPVTFSTGAEPVFFSDKFITADVNGDGKKDIVTSEGLVFFGLGNGTNYAFESIAFPRIVTATNGLAPGIVAADFNNDNRLDLATDDGTTIRIYLGNGDGTFSPSGAYATIPNRGLILATDLDGDGNMDLVSGYAGLGTYGGDDYLPNQELALMGNGDGTFQGAPSLPIVYTGTNLLDLNGDGRPDLVGLRYNGTQNEFDTYLTNASGVPVYSASQLVASGVSVDSYAVGAFDTNSNTTADLIYLSAGPQTQYFYLALGVSDGNFNAPTQIPVPSLVPAPGIDINETVSGLHAADFNHDGKLDIVYSFIDQSNIAPQNYYEGFAVQLGNGDGTFQPPQIVYTYQNQNAPSQAFGNLLSFVADVNKDNFPDVFLILPPAVVNQPEVAELFVGKGDGTFQSPNALNLVPNYFPPTNDGSYGAPFALADLNGDGKLDIVASGSSSDGTVPQVAIALGNGDGTFKSPTILELEGFGYAGSPALADFDGDGKIDLYVGGVTEGTGLGIFPGKGDGTFTTISNGDGTVSAPDLIALGGGGGAVPVDLNKDGKIDLIVGGVILLNKSSAVQPVLAPTTTVVTSSLNPSTVGASVTFSATVTSTTAGTITGTVNFLDGATTIGSGTITAGVATYSTTTLTQGPHTITAVYVGDTNYATSTSTAITQTVNASTKAATSTVVVSTVNPSVYGNTAGFNATVTSTTPGNFTGTVSYYDGATLLGSGPIQSNGKSDLFTPDFNVGANSITAQYSGDGNYAASTSPAIIQTVTIAPTTTTLTGSPTSAAAGTSIMFTATTTTSGTFAITGSVNLLDGGTTILPATIGAGGVTTFSTTTLAVGMHTITAQYVGNTDFVGSTSSAVTVNITSAGTFMLSANPSAVTITASTPGTTTITVTPAGGFNQTVNLSCANPPAGYSCTFGPPSVTPNGGAVSSMLTITDGLTGGAARTRRSVTGISPASGAGPGSGENGGTRMGARWFGALLATNRLYAFALGGELCLLGTALRAPQKILRAQSGCVQRTYAWRTRRTLQWRRSSPGLRVDRAGNGSNHHGRMRRPRPDANNHHHRQRHVRHANRNAAADHHHPEIAPASCTRTLPPATQAV